MEPEELVTELNEYFTAMTDIVFKHGGTLDKYVGDAVMVFFGDPIPQDDHAERAVRMGFEMLEQIRALEDHWFRRFDVEFRIGIGIATGWVTVGDIGSPARSDYTVLGNQVNLASRLADKADARPDPRDRADDEGGGPHRRGTRDRPGEPEGHQPPDQDLRSAPRRGRLEYPAFDATPP